jgi:hypothetical protein
MVFWIGILIAVGFAYSAIKLGFYQAWTMLFNVVIAVYLGVMLGPAIAEFVPMDSQYSKTLAVLAAGVGAFVVLHGISYVFLLGQFTVTFSRVLNTLGSALLGFLAGFLVWSFAVLVICTTPFCENVFVKEIGFDGKTFEEAKMQPYLVWWCNLVDKVAAPGDGRAGTEQALRPRSPRLRSGQAGQAIKNLLTTPVKRSTKGITGKSGLRGMTDVNEPNQPAVQPPPEPHTVIPP